MSNHIGYDMMFQSGQVISIPFPLKFRTNFSTVWIFGLLLVTMYKYSTTTSQSSGYSAGGSSYSQYYYHLPTHTMLQLQHHKSSLHQFHTKLCPHMSYNLAMFHITQQKHWMLSPIGIYQLKLFQLSQHHLQAQVLRYPKKISNPWHFHSMLWRGCWYLSGKANIGYSVNVLHI